MWHTPTLPDQAFRVTLASMTLRARRWSCARDFAPGVVVLALLVVVYCILGLVAAGLDAEDALCTGGCRCEIRQE